VNRWLVGVVVVGLGAELHQRPHAARGALLQSDWLRKTHGAVAEGLAGMAELRRLCPGGPGGEKPLLCHHSQALSNVQEEGPSFARGQDPRW
jgi:hypothetical protein